MSGTKPRPTDLQPLDRALVMARSYGGSVHDVADAIDALIRQRIEDHARELVGGTEGGTPPPVSEEEESRRVHAFARMREQSDSGVGQATIYGIRVDSMDPEETRLALGWALTRIRELEQRRRGY